MPDRATAVAFRSAYADAFARYLVAGDETALRAAYELGRDAVEHELSVLELALVHHEALEGALVGDEVDVAATTAAAARFFVESLSSFEMLRRGFRDARDTALAERRQTTLLRRLSSFLADASLAAGGTESHQELLQLVAEQALEVVDAEYCIAAASLGGAGQLVAFAAGDAGLQAIPAWVAAMAEQPPAAERVRRVSHAETATAAAAGEGPRSALAAPLRGLDGRAFGSLRLFDRREGEFTDVDEAVVVHLAELAAAALERARLYAEAHPSAVRER